MPTTPPQTVSEYLRGLDPERRAILSAVRKVVNAHLPDGYVEALTYGMIAWQIPLKTFPNTYNGQPLCCAALGANKNYNSLHLMGAYGDPRNRAVLEEAYKASGRKIDMGKACLRFKTLEELPLDAIGAVIERTPAAALMAAHDAAHTKKPARKAKAPKSGR